jgi:hypothetical protein
VILFLVSFFIRKRQPPHTARVKELARMTILEPTESLSWEVTSSPGAAASSGRT